MARPKRDENASQASQDHGGQRRCWLDLADVCMHGADLLARRKSVRARNRAHDFVQSGYVQCLHVLFQGDEALATAERAALKE